MIGADKTVFLHPLGNPLRSSQLNGTVHATVIWINSTQGLQINRSLFELHVFPKKCSYQVKWLRLWTVNSHSLCTAATLVHAVGIGGHTAQMGSSTCRWEDLWLPAVMPVPVVAAAGESLTASVPPPAVYGYTPNQSAPGSARDAANQRAPGQARSKSQPRQPVTSAEQEWAGKRRAEIHWRGVKVGIKSEIDEER